MVNQIMVHETETRFMLTSNRASPLAGTAHDGASYVVGRNGRDDVVVPG